MDRSNEAQQLKAKLLSVVRSRNLAYIYAATTAISDQTHTRTRVSQSRTFQFRSGCSVCSARGLLVITRSFTRSSHRFRHSMLSLFVALATLVAAARAQLSPTFYASSCPAALVTIKTAVRAAVLLDRRTAASLLRLHFHDCFVQASPVLC